MHITRICRTAIFFSCQPPRYTHKAGLLFDLLLMFDYQAKVALSVLKASVFIMHINVHTKVLSCLFFFNFRYGL